jgi:hypothetical protein
VLITRNLPFSMMTAAAIGRLVHRCVIVELHIPSYRVEEAKKKQPAEAQPAAPLAPFAPSDGLDRASRAK